MVRLASGLVLAAATLAAILFLPPLGLRILVCLVAALAAHEYLRIVGSNDLPLVLVVGLCWLTSGGGTVSLDLALVVGLAWVGAAVLFAGQAVQTAAAGVFAAVYVGLPLGMLAAAQTRMGWQATVLLIATVVVSDSLQYYSGRAFGRHPLAPAISPKKTIEGAIGGLVAGTVFMALAGGLVFPAIPKPWLAILGLTIVVLGISGDLFESRLKRVAGVKDSAALIPGHGGVLDRIDALLFAIPAFYLFVGRAA